MLESSPSYMFVRVYTASLKPLELIGFHKNHWPEISRQFAFFSLRGYLLCFCGKTLSLVKVLQDLLLKNINIGTFSRTFCSVIDGISQYPGQTASLWCSGYHYYTISHHRFWTFEILFIASQGFMQYRKCCLEARFVLLYHCYTVALLYHC